MSMVTLKISSPLSGGSKLLVPSTACQAEEENGHLVPSAGLAPCHTHQKQHRARGGGVMAEFGGLGGLVEGRELNTEDDFEMMLARVFGERMKTDDELCKQIWSSLANVDWYKPTTHDSASYSFRAAGDLIAAIRGEGDYMDWYCSGPYPEITDEIRRSLKKEGWIADDMPSICDEPGCLESAGCGWSESKGKYRHTCRKHMGTHNPHGEAA